LWGVEVSPPPPPPPPPAMGATTTHAAQVPALDNLSDDSSPDVC
jgi:hypothetical protein